MINLIVLGTAKSHHLSRKAFFELLDVAYKLGIRNIDTADIYGYGLTNLRLRAWLHRRSISDVIITNKVGLVLRPKYKARNRVMCYVVHMLVKCKVVKKEWNADIAEFKSDVDQSIKLGYRVLLHDPFTFGVSNDKVLHLLRLQGLDGIGGYISSSDTLLYSEYFLQTQFDGTLNDNVNRYYRVREESDIMNLTKVKTSFDVIIGSRSPEKLFGYYKMYTSNSSILR